jgi:hypothetical protein
MAPEQFTGTRVDEKCDLYALAVLINEMVSGRVPWGQDALPQPQQPHHLPSPPQSQHGPPTAISPATSHQAATATSAVGEFSIFVTGVMTAVSSNSARATTESCCKALPHAPQNARGAVSVRHLAERRYTSPQPTCLQTKDSAAVGMAGGPNSAGSIEVTTEHPVSSLFASCPTATDARLSSQQCVSSLVAAIAGGGGGSAAEVAAPGLHTPPRGWDTTQPATHFSPLAQSGAGVHLQHQGHMQASAGPFMCSQPRPGGSEVGRAGGDGQPGGGLALFQVRCLQLTSTTLSLF